jgi:hypothetical protein
MRLRRLFQGLKLAQKANLGAKVVIFCDIHKFKGEIFFLFAYMQEFLYLRGHLNPRSCCKKM